MKKLLFIVAIIIVPFIFTSCENDKDDNFDFNYPLKTLYGTWQVTHWKATIPGDYIEWLEERTTATFYKNGKYYGEGAFGKFNGTYTAIGDRITTYVNGKEGYYYHVISLNGNTAEFLLGNDNSPIIGSIIIKCKKQ